MSETQEPWQGIAGVPLPPSRDPNAPQLKVGDRLRNRNGWDVLLCLGLGLFVAMSGPSILQMVQGVEAGEGVVTIPVVVFGLIIMFTMTGIIPTMWAFGTRGSWAGVVERLGLRTTATHWGMALLMTLGYLALAFGLTFVVSQFADDTDSTVDPILSILNWPLIFFISFVAGVGEEILFRGVLQKWLGWIGQGVLFGLAHAGPGTEIQVGFTMMIGLTLGFARHKGMGLPALMLVHFLYDFILLGLYMLAGNLLGEEAFHVWRP